MDGLLCDPIDRKHLRSDHPASPSKSTLQAMYPTLVLALAALRAVPTQRVSLNLNAHPLGRVRLSADSAATAAEAVDLPVTVIPKASFAHEDDSSFMFEGVKHTGLV